MHSRINGKLTMEVAYAKRGKWKWTERNENKFKEKKNAMWNSDDIA